MSTLIEAQVNKLTKGTKISLITDAKYRYEGIVREINSVEGTLTLENVKFWGNGDRLSLNTSNRENKTPKVGTQFDSVTFWISNLIKIWFSDKNITNEFGDIAVVNAAISKVNKPKQTSQFNKRYTVGNQEKFVNHQNTTNQSKYQFRHKPNLMNRYGMNQSLTPQYRSNTSYTKRGGNASTFWKSNYMPFAGSVPSGIRYREPYRSSSRNVPHYSVINNTSKMMGQRFNSRRSIQETKPFNRCNTIIPRQYFSENMNEGVFLYVPAEMAHSYYSDSLNYNSRPNYNKIKTSSKRKIPNVNRNDCSKPYDFETANAELEVELAKMNLDIDKSSNVSTSDHIETSDNQVPTDCNVSTSLENMKKASGDSLNGAVTLITRNNKNPTENGLDTGKSAKSKKWEYYSREKGFFDHLSCPETYITNSLNDKQNYFESKSKVNSTGIQSNAGAMSSGIAARRERQLNFQTFGPMATRPSSFNSRRRQTGNISHDMLISTSA